MYVDGQTIITAGAILSALLLLGGILFKVYKWYLKQQDQDNEIQHIKNENRLVVTALYACLDGLEQLGANHTVPETKKKLNDHLNNIAHE
ncbi:MAG: branched-chain amino acid ABC transporter permease [Christensenellaceae bacterium]|nr:branched-chain amino acid ABC transporter permease [Christensenellaceae bacterium]